MRNEARPDSDVDILVEFDRYPDIEWRKIAGLRDILAHAYFSLENEILWDIVQNKVLPLLAQVEHI